MGKVRRIPILLVAGLAFLWSGPGWGQEVAFSRGDTNADGTFDLSDPIFFLLASFGGGDEVSCRDAADANDDGELNLADAVYALGGLFLDGPAPAPPHPGCGFDPTADTLDCASYSACEPILPVPPFRVTLHSDRQSGVVGTVFSLRGNALGTPAQIVSYLWDLGGGLEATTERADVSFDQAGVHVVSLTLGDALGREARGQIALTVFDDRPPPVVTSKISPQEGQPGIRVRIESPFLLEPDDLIELQIGEAEPYTPFRSELGVVNGFIPLDAGGRDPTSFEAHEVSVAILVEGVPVESFPFQLNPHDPLPGDPGELLEEVCDLLVLSTEGMTEGFVGYLDAIGASEEERALVLALMAKTRADLEDNRTRASSLLSRMSPELVALMEYAALANGLEEALGALRAAVTHEGRGGGGAVGSRFFDEICKFTARANTVEDVATATSVICPALSVLSWIPGPQQPFLSVLSVICTAAQVVTNTVNDVYADLIPKIGPNLIVTADPPSIAPGRRAKIKVEVQLTLEPGFCTGALDLEEKIAKEAVENLVRGLLPGFVADLILEYSETEDTIRASVLNYITEFTTGVVDELGVANTLIDLRDTVCASLQNDRVQISTAALQARHAFFASGGDLTPGPAEATFACSEGDCESVQTIRATMNICAGTSLDQTLVGSEEVQCSIPKVDGRWRANETCSGCDAENSSYSVSVAQTDGHLELTGGLVGGPRGTGTVAMDCSGTFSWEGSFEDWDGVTTEKVTITFRANGTLDGGSSWIWEGTGAFDGESCRGACNINGNYLGSR